jgi:hypothetical protein
MIIDADTQRRFGGIERLYGAGALARATAAHITVIGIGGVGSWAAEALARSGIGRLTLIDLDHVAESNINRQVQALGTTLGAAKVAAMRERILAINPDCTVECVEDFIDEGNVAGLLPACDAVVDAIDQVRAKAALIAHCRRAGLRIVTTGGAGGRRDPTRIEITDLSRTTRMRWPPRSAPVCARSTASAATRSRSSASTACSRRSRRRAGDASCAVPAAEFDAGAGLELRRLWLLGCRHRQFRLSPRRRGCSPLYSSGMMASPPAPVVLVTGAARRVGAEIARTLHAAGARLAIHCRPRAPRPRTSPPD